MGPAEEGKSSNGKGGQALRRPIETHLRHYYRLRDIPTQPRSDRLTQDMEVSSSRSPPRSSGSTSCSRPASKRGACFYCYADEAASSPRGSARRLRGVTPPARRLLLTVHAAGRRSCSPPRASARAVARAVQAAALRARRGGRRQRRQPQRAGERGPRSRRACKAQGGLRRQELRRSRAAAAFDPSDFLKPTTCAFPRRSSCPLGAAPPRGGIGGDHRRGPPAASPEALAAVSLAT